MLPSDLSIYPSEWLEGEIARRRKLLDSQPGSDRDDIEDDLQMLEATLESKNMYRRQLHGQGQPLLPDRYGALNFPSPGAQSEWPSSLVPRIPSQPQSLAVRGSPQAKIFNAGPSFTEPSYRRDDPYSTGFSSCSSSNPSTPGLPPPHLLQQNASGLAMPSQENLRKRGLSSPQSQPQRHNKSARATPGSSTPAQMLFPPADGEVWPDFSTDGLGSDIHPDVLAALRQDGIGPEDIQKFLADQDVLYTKTAQEAADAELARNLVHAAAPSSSETRPGPSNPAGGTAYQTYLGTNGAIQRQHPGLGPAGTVQLDHQPASSLPALQDSSLPLLPHASSFAPAAPPSSHSAPLHASEFPSRPLMGSNFYQLALDSSQSSSSSEDIMEIQRTDFVPNQRSRQFDASAYGIWPTTHRPPPTAHPNSAAYGAHGAGGSSVYPSASIPNPGSSFNAMTGAILRAAQAPSSLGYDLGGHVKRVFADTLDSWNPFTFGTDEGGSVPYDPYYDRGMAAKQTSDAIQELVDNIYHDEELEKDEYTRTPEDLAEDCPLFDHQKLGLAWMKRMEEGSNKGGILADDMGLGKTVQAIALMLANRPTDPAVKTTLVIAPVALLQQWESEIRAKVKPDRRMSTLIYHGSGQKNLAWNTVKRYDVVLTTYGTLASEYKRKMGDDGQQQANTAKDADAAKLVLLHPNAVFHRVILDEAQHIRNHLTKTFKSVRMLQANTRFCMTGTPMMNKLDEFFSLIAFLRIRPFNDWEQFRTRIAQPIGRQSKGQQDKGMRQLHALLKATLLRRTKKSEIKGRPILNLPERINHVDHAVLQGDQLEFYTALENRTQLRFNSFLNRGAVGKSYSHFLILLLRLRQACCHPHLISDFEQETNYLQKSPEELERVAEELLSPETVRRIVSEGMGDCPICMDATENAIIFTPCGHRTCSECFMRISEPTDDMREDTSQPTRFKCMSCRGVVETHKVTDWNSFVKVHMPEEFEKKQEEQAEDEELLRKTSLAGAGTGNTDHADVKDESEADRNRKGKGKANDDTSADGKKMTRKKLADLRNESKSNMAARRRYLRALKQNWVSSAKIDKCMELLDRITKDTADEKTIVFSSFTSFLDLVEVALQDRPWMYTRYDGTMTATARHKAVQEFAERKPCRVMLISLKAGNAGLNLTAANHVIILDPFWNPYIEEQAIDRAHRIGQHRPVQVHRILIKGTVEDRIMDIQERKRNMIDSALDENASMAVTRLDKRDLAYLFVGGPLL